MYNTCTYYSSQYQRTALNYASEAGHHDTVRVLIERGADPMANPHDWVSGEYVSYMGHILYYYVVFVFSLGHEVQYREVSCIYRALCVI